MKRPQRDSRRELFEPRSDLVVRLADTLTSPRLQLALMMTVAGAAAFFASVLLLWLPAEAFDRMALRYAAAALCGYLAFVGLIRVWISFHRPAEDDCRPDLNPLDVINPSDVVPSGSAAEEAPPMFAQGRSGGGGASSQWSASDSRQTTGPGRSWGIDIDGDVAVWLIIAGVCAAAGLIAVGYVVYMAPALLAEVALDAAIISVLYRRLRRDERGYWLTTVLRRTWAPGLVLVMFAFLTGFALQKAAPQARSIGAVIQSVAETNAR